MKSGAVATTWPFDLFDPHDGPLHKMERIDCMKERKVPRKRQEIVAPLPQLRDVAQRILAPLLLCMPISRPTAGFRTTKDKKRRRETKQTRWRSRTKQTHHCRNCGMLLRGYSRPCSLPLTSRPTHVSYTCSRRVFSSSRSPIVSTEVTMLASCIRRSRMSSRHR